MTSGPIVLLTDFGSQDTYAGVMRGVIAGIAPEAHALDLTHAIPPGDIRQAAFQLWRAAPYFPTGSVFLIVVDPGVGTSRRALAATCAGASFVAPDNGLLTYVLAGQTGVRAVEISRPGIAGRRPSATFHGRDVFAPAAARLARGDALSELGEPVDDWIRLPFPRLEVQAGERVHGEIVHVDGYGNLVTSIGRLETSGDRLRLQPWLPGVPSFQGDSRHARAAPYTGLELPLERTFASVAPGEPVAYVGSDGLLEIAVNQGRADEMLGLKRSDGVALHCQPRMVP